MESTAAPKPLARSYRWIVLAIMSLICFAQYYIYDSITPLGQLDQGSSSASRGAEYGLLFSFYAVANVFFFLLLFAGVLVDKIGLKYSGILFGFLCFLGAALTALGAWKGLPGLLGPAHGWLGARSHRRSFRGVRAWWGKPGAPSSRSCCSAA